MEISDMGYIENMINRRCVKAFLDVIILDTLRNGGSSGYDIVNKVYEKFDVLLSASAVYSVLDSLKKKHLVYVEHDGRRKIFSFTRKGHLYADTVIEEYEKFTSQLVSSKIVRSARYNL
ncbi:MAG: PadR family transcriptional regulator [Nitrososphaerales archaeon]